MAARLAPIRYDGGMAPEEPSTLDGSGDARERGRSAEPAPGIVKLFAGGSACFELTALAGRRLVTIGRDPECGVRLADKRASRRHAEVAFLDGRWLVRDLDSHNGTFLDGRRIGGASEAAGTGLIKIGDTLLLLEADLGPLRGGFEFQDTLVIGPRLASAWKTVRRAATKDRVLHITGETGTGKEVAARLFHSASARAGQPFVAVNCATIPPLLAERLLFGARKGAYSGAEANSDGWLSTAHGGTLLLDEIGELPLEVQAKLLRALETGEVFALGAARPILVDVAFCSATHADLRQRVAAGAFREDLYFRIARPSVRLPPLRERREEIPWIVQAALSRESRAPHVSLIAEALMRPWPGNVRELIRETVAAAHASPEAMVHAEHLSRDAGGALGVAVAGEATTPAMAEPRPDVLEALVAARGNISQAARMLGWHRTQLRRWVEQSGIDPKQLGK
jgi:transcriptional regulator with AAA-type ATPase domain